jgi:hypothetical protein
MQQHPFSNSPDPRKRQTPPKSSRHSKLTPHSRRLTPLEVTQHWFRRGRDFVIYDTFPDFPQPGPDGLYLLSQVEDFFGRIHGMATADTETSAQEEAKAMRAALGH